MGADLTHNPKRRFASGTENPATDASNLGIPRNHSGSWALSAVIVTHNRKRLLIDCVRAVLGQSVACDVIVVDSASTDGTADALAEEGLLELPRVRYLPLPENIGGAGGFARGLQYGMGLGYDWFWLMDDDAFPDCDALEELLKVSDNVNTVYASAAVFHREGDRFFCSPPNAIHRSGIGYIERLADLSSTEEVAGLPFLGFFIHRSMVERIGLPREDFFIYWDDLEYSERVKRYGGKLVLVRESVLQHPIPKISTLRVGRLKAAYRQLSPWKAYYETRNKIITSREYYGTALWTKTLPGILYRLFLALLTEENRSGLFPAFMRGVLDGLTGRTGKRYLPS